MAVSKAWTSISCFICTLHYLTAASQNVGTVNPLCWNDKFTFSSCCNSSIGPFGNLQCWEGSYTYDVCCVPAQTQGRLVEKFRSATRRIDKVDDGFFITSVHALTDVVKLQELGITSILNAAHYDLYESNASAFAPFWEQFDIKVLGWDDSEEFNVTGQFYELAEFIEEGRKSGGVLVHCAAGISRAATAALTYMMIKQHLSLDAAFIRLRCVRNFVQPNYAYWRQMRDFEAVLQAEGVKLQQLPDGLNLAEGPEAFKTLEELDRESALLRPLAHFITAKVTLGNPTEEAAQMVGGQLAYARNERMRVTSMLTDVAWAFLVARVWCQLSVTSGEVEAWLATFPGVAAVAAESHDPFKPKGRS